MTCMTFFDPFLNIFSPGLDIKSNTGMLFDPVRDETEYAKVFTNVYPDEAMNKAEDMIECKWKNLIFILKYRSFLVNLLTRQEGDRRHSMLFVKWPFTRLYRDLKARDICFKQCFVRP